MDDDRITSVTDVFERALNEIQARVFVSAPRRVAVAYSGGLDSSALLHLAQRHAIKRGLELYAFHVHHGLSPNADAWLSHCEQACKAAGVVFDARHVMVEKGGSVEQSARLSRYAALGAMCVEHEIPLLLTAHHLDDQAETVLLQLLRGSGVAGLGGMESCNRAPGLLKTDAVSIARPLLAIGRAALESYVAANGIRFIDDESNTDVRYARNALRHGVMPLLAGHFPGFAERLARSAVHARGAQRLLDQLAENDFAAASDGTSLSLQVLNALDSDRADNLVRYWFSLRGKRMPSTAWLTEMRQQLASPSEDAQICVIHPDCEIRRYQGRAYMAPRRAAAATEAASVAFQWSGEEEMAFESFFGRLVFEKLAPGAGLDATWLQAQTLCLHRRQGGEKLKTSPDRPTRTLKHHYQSLQIPYWERPWLPLVSTSQGKLVFAAGVGMNRRELPAGDIAMRWQPTSE